MGRSRSTIIKTDYEQNLESIIPESAGIIDFSTDISTDRPHSINHNKI